MKFQEAINQGLIRVGAVVSISTDATIKRVGRISWVSSREFGISRFDGITGTGPYGTWRFNLGDVTCDITFSEDTGIAPPLLYEVKISDKPQGNWRPKATIEFSPVVNILNINPVIRLAIKASGAPLDGMVLYEINLPLYMEASRWKTDKADGIKYTIDTSLGLSSTEGYIPLYLDWRHGLKPSYADYATHFKKACDLVVAEYNRRCREALSSGATDPIIITPETQEERKEVTRKIRLLNKDQS